VIPSTITGLVSTWRRSASIQREKERVGRDGISIGNRVGAFGIHTPGWSSRKAEKVAWEGASREAKRREETRLWAKCGRIVMGTSTSWHATWVVIVWNAVRRKAPKHRSETFAWAELDIDSLSDRDGSYRVACPKTGDGLVTRFEFGYVRGGLWRLASLGWGRDGGSANYKISPFIESG
jgi:hypothetical protein